MNDLKRLFGKAIDSVEKASITHGYLGRFLLDGSEQVEVPGQPDIVWVRVGTAETDINVTRARNVGVPLIFGLPVKMKLIDGQYRIIDIDHDRLDVGVEPPIGAINSVWGLVDTPFNPEDNPGKILVVAGTDLVFDNANNHLHSLAELDDVSLAGSIVDGQALIWNDSTSLWVRGIPIHEIDDHSNVNIISPTDGQILRYNVAGSEWVNDDESAGGVTDHTLLTNIGTNTHVQIDTHIADATIHFTQGSIDHGSIAGLGDDDHTQYALLAGRSGGQTLNGDTALGGALKLQSTAHATKGSLRLLDATIVGSDTAPGAKFEVNESANADVFQFIRGRGGNEKVAGLILLTLDGAGANDGGIIYHDGTKLHLSDTTGTSVPHLTIDDGNVGIGVAGPSVPLHVAGQALISGPTFPVLRVERTTTGTGDALASKDLLLTTSNDMANSFGPLMSFSIRDNAAIINVIGALGFVRDGADNSGALIIRTVSAGTTAERLRITNGGNLGIGVTAPQGRLHGHDGTGGFLHTSKTGVAGTAVTIIPDGTGDILYGARINVLCRSSAGILQSVEQLFSGAGEGDIYNNGTNTEVCKLRINADGSMDVRRTAGTLTYTVSIWLHWL